jgi:ATP-binding cassette subfamily F protein 3
MSIININQVSHDFGNKELFENINLSFDKNCRAGLIGRNGCGKSTLFKIIAGIITPTKGEVHIAKDKKYFLNNSNKKTSSIGYFSQDFKFADDEILWDSLYNARQDLIDKKNELSLIGKKLEINHNAKLLSDLDKIQLEYELIGGFTYENEIKSLLYTFGFKTEEYHNRVNDFSGGQQTRIRLIQILLNKYDFILFDEPTNHLDIKTVDWFIKYLKNMTGGYLIISHDRYLLDQTVEIIYELSHKTIHTFSGNYSAYLLQSEEREKVLQRQYNQQQKLIEKTEDFIRKNMAGQKVNQAKSRLKMLNRMEKIELNQKDKTFNLNISSEKRSGNDIFRLKNLSIGYPNNTLIQNINLNLHYQEKICLVGTNGSGKTTLLKILNNELNPLSGDIWTGYNLSIGYFDQNHIDLDISLTVLETIWELVPGETFGYVMTFLAKFGFTDSMVEQKVQNLSGGEKSRLYLARLIHEKPNLLILDEPTNHLDITMIESLETALKNYDGTILLVSHDRYFIQAITNQYWIINDKNIKTFNGNIDEILSDIFEEENQQINTKNTNELKNNNSTKKKKPNQYIINKMLEEIENIENKIEENENQMNILHEKFHNQDFYNNQNDVIETNKAIETLKIDIEDLYTKKDSLETEYLLLTLEENQ